MVKVFPSAIGQILRAPLDLILRRNALMTGILSEALMDTDEFMSSMMRGLDDKTII